MSETNDYWQGRFKANLEISAAARVWAAVDAQRRAIDAGECPFRRVVVGKMETCTQWDGYWHVEADDGAYTVALVATKEMAEYLAALLNAHGARGAAP
jgi:hypothetical protein